MTITCGRLPCRGEFTRPPSSARPVASGAATSWATHWPVAFRRSELARDQMMAPASKQDAALSSAGTTGCALHGAWLAFVSRGRSIVRVGGSIGFALLGESLLAVAPKGTKRSCPCIRVSLRSTPLIPSTLRGPAYKGHPWPFTPLAASMPLAPLRVDSIRPPERGVWRRLMVRSRNNRKSISTQQRFVCVPNRNENLVGWRTVKHFPPRSIPRLISDLTHKKRWVSFALPTLRSLEARTTGSLHGPSDTTGSPLSGGRAQVAWKGLSGMDAARAALSHGWPVAAGPWNVTGARELRRSRGRMQGQAFLLTFLAIEKSESPSRAKPMPQPPPPIGRPPQIPSQKPSRASSLPKHQLPKHFANSTPGPLSPVASCRQSTVKRLCKCA
jgi:hypothetical protein